jgi:hypothetical protein
LVLAVHRSVELNRPRELALPFGSVPSSGVYKGS